MQKKIEVKSNFLNPNCMAHKVIENTSDFDSNLSFPYPKIEEITLVVGRGASVVHNRTGCDVRRLCDARTKRKKGGSFSIVKSYLGCYCLAEIHKGSARKLHRQI